MQKRYLKFIYIFILLSPFIDLITSLTMRLTNVNITLGLLVRGLFLCILVIYLLFFNKSKFKNISKIYIVFLIAFFAIYIITKTSVFTEITYMFKYLYFPITIVSFICINDEYKINNKIVSKTFQINIVIFTILLLLSFITNTSFNSYEYSKVGSVGWFYSANEISALLTILFPYIIYNLKRYKSYKTLLLILPILFAMSIIGTKTSFLGILIPLLLFAIYFFFKKNKYTIKPFIVIIISLLFTILLSPFLTVIDNIKETVHIKDNHIDVSNGRDKFLKDIKYIYNSNGNYVMFFGTGFTNTDIIKDGHIEKLIEMDFYDVFYRYGIIGFTLYFLPILIVGIYLIKYVLNNKFKLSYDKLLYIYSIFVGLSISFLAGHVLGSPSVSVYLSLLITMLINDMFYKEKLINKITIYSLTLGYGGIEKYVSSLCKMLNDYEIEIISTYKMYKKPPYEFDPNVKIKYLINKGPNKQEFLNALKTKKILLILKEGIKSINILYKKYILNLKNIVNNNSKYIITTGFNNYLVSEYASYDSIKIATEHNYHNNNSKYINKLISSIMYYDYLVLVSPELQNFYKDKTGITKCIYIPNVIDKLPNKESKLNTNNLINVCRFVNEKGLFDLIDIFGMVHNKIKDSKLYLIGDGYLKNDIIKYINNKNLKENIILTGLLNIKEQEKYYLDSSLYVLTSYTESFGLTIIESFSYKVPCIGFDSSSGAKLLMNDTGILIKNRDKEKISKEIINVLNNKKLLKELSIKSYNSIDKYLLENVKIKWINLLKESENK